LEGWKWREREMVKKLELLLPDELVDRLHAIEKKYKVSLQDLILRTLVKVLEEMEGKTT